MIIPTDLICINCKFFNPDLQEMGFYFCDAFPNPEPWTDEELKQRQAEGITIDPKGIPDEIIFGENDHTTPCCGQVGDFVFTPIENKTE